METLDYVVTCDCGHTLNDHAREGCIVYGCACARGLRDPDGERMSEAY